MKIISKYKDFYDYIVQDNDADLVYVRKIGVINKNYDSLYKKHDKYISYNYDRYINYNPGLIMFSNYIFGIYPFVYSQPIITIDVRTITGHNETRKIILNKTIVDNILSDSVNVSTNAINQLVNEAQNLINNDRFLKPCKVFFSYRNIKNSLSKYVWKIKCEEIFYKMNAPTFTKYYYNLYETSCYWYNEWPVPHPYKETIHYVTNISFNKLSENIIKYWYNELFNINTYINIENFLWSVKQEPESKPDNKTKIVSHGFDLKTSFRKM